MASSHFFPQIPEVFRKRLFTCSAAPRLANSTVRVERVLPSEQRHYAHQATTITASPTEFGASIFPGVPTPLDTKRTWKRDDVPRIPDELLLLRKTLLQPPRGVNQLALQTALLMETRDTEQGSRQADGSTEFAEWETDMFHHNLRTGNTNALYRWLIPKRGTVQDIDRNRHRRHAFLANLPPLVFSELLRCLDPFAVREKADHARDIVISQGMAQLTPLAKQVDVFGVRQVYSALFQELHSVYVMRYNSRKYGFLPRDFIVLLRCAGAVSDVVAAKQIWNEMEQLAGTEWRDSDIYTEFVRARFLTEPLYTQQDSLRMRLRPADMHKQQMVIRPVTRMIRLENLRMALERKRLMRFGQNPASPGFAENLTRILRKTRPLQHLFNNVNRLGHANNEQLLAAFIVAMGRTGSVEGIGMILNKYWGITVTRKDEDGEYYASGGRTFPLESPLRPSSTLLEAVVQAYSCCGLVACALRVASHLCQRYSLDMPAHVWYTLLDWAYLMTTRPLITEWMLAGFPERTLETHTPLMVWKAMRADPKSVQPGFPQYHVIAKTLIHMGRWKDAVEIMREARALYAAQLRRYEKALMVFSETARQGMNAQEAAKEVGRASSEKWYMWYCLRTLSWTLLKKHRTRDMNDAVVAKDIPSFISEFREFISQEATYQTAGGIVQLHEPHRHLKYNLKWQTVAMPTLRPHNNFPLTSGSGEGIVDERLFHMREDIQRMRQLVRRQVTRKEKKLVCEPLSWKLNTEALGRKTSRRWLVWEFT